MAIKKVFVGNLGNVVSDETLRRAFQDYGEIIDVLLIEDKQTGFKSYGFVTFRNTKAAEDAINALQHTILNGRRLTVQMAKSEHEKEHYRGRRSPGGYYHHHHRNHRSRSRSPHGERGGWGRGRADRRREWAGDGYDESQGAWDAYGDGDGRRYREHERNPRRRAWEDDGAGVAAPPRRRESRWNRETDDGGPFSGMNSGGAEFSNHHHQQEQHSYDDWGAPAPVQGDYGKDDYRYHLTARREVDQFKAFHQQIHSKPLPQPHHHQDRYGMNHDSQPPQQQQQQQQQQHQSQFHHHHQQQQQQRSRQSDDDVPYRRISVDEDPYVMDDFVQGRFSHESPDNSRYDATRRQQAQQQVQQQQSYSRQQLPARQAPSAFDYAPAAPAKESEYVPKKRKYYQEEGTDVYGQAALMKKLPSAQPPAANRQDAYKLSSSSLSSRQTPAAAAAAAVAAAVSQYSLSHSQDQDWGDYRQRETQTGNSYYRSADPRTRSAPAAAAAAANSSSVDSALSTIASLRSRRLGNELQSSQAKPATAVTKPSSAWDQAVTAATTSDYAAAKSRSSSSRWSPPPSSRAVVADYSPQQQQQQQQQVPSQQRTTSRSYHQYEQPAERDSGVASQIRSSVTNRPSDVYEGYSPTRPQIYSSGATRAVASASQSTPSPSLSALAGSAYGTRLSADSTSTQYNSTTLADPRVYPTSTAASLRLSGGARSTDVQSSASLARSSYAEAYQPKSTSLAGSSSYAGSSAAASSRVLASSGVTPSYWSSQSSEKSYEGGTGSSGVSVKARSSTENTREPIRFGFVGGERDASSSAYSSYSSFRQGKSS